MPCLLSSAKHLLQFIKNNEIPKQTSKGKMSIVDLFIYDKLDESTVSAFINGVGSLFKSLDLLYSNSEYKDYILPLCESCGSSPSSASWSSKSISQCLNSVLKSDKFLKNLNQDLLPLVQPQKVGKSILQLQKVQVVPIKTFKTEKEFYSKEANDEKRLKKEFKKAYRDAKRELKKDSQMLHELRQEEVRVKHHFYSKTNDLSEIWLNVRELDEWWTKNKQNSNFHKSKMPHKRKRSNLRTIKMEEWPETKLTPSKIEFFNLEDDN